MATETSLDQYGLTQRGVGRVPLYVLNCGVWHLKGTGPNGEVVARPFRCGNRLCDSCRLVIVRKWTAIVSGGYELAPKQCKFVTITCAPYYKPDIAWLAFPSNWNLLRRALDRAYGSFDYIRSVEATKRGRPHYHLLVRGPFWPQHELSAACERAGFGPVCWINRVKDGTQARRYVLKYLLKDIHLPLDFHQRRVARSFWWCPDVPRETLPGWTWELVRDDGSPAGNVPTSGELEEPWQS